MRNRTTPWLLLAGLSVGFAAHAAEPTAPAAEENVGSYQGVTVAIDPATGKLVAPTAAQLAELRAAAPRAVSAQRGQAGYTPKTRAEAELTTQRHPGGRVSMQVSEDMMSYVTAVKQPDGSVKVVHAAMDADGNLVPAAEGRDSE